MAKSSITALLLYLLMMSGTIHGQPPVPKDVKHLYQQLANAKVDTSLVNLLISICRYDNANSATQPKLADSALAISARAKYFAEKLNYTRGIGLSYQVMAQAWCNRKVFGKSDELIKKALNIFLTQKLYSDAAECYLNLEEFYQAADGTDMNVRIHYYEQAQPLFHQAGAFNREGATLERLGDFYQVLKKLDQSLVALNNALVAYKKVHFPKLQFAYDLMGTVYMQKSQYREALRYGLLAEKTALALKDTSVLLCTIYCRLGSTYFLINEVGQAHIFFAKALKIAEKFHDTPAIRISMQSLFAVLATERKYPEALALLQETVKKYPSANTEEIIMFNANFIRSYSGMKNYKMAEHYANILLKNGLLSEGGSTMAYALSEMIEYFIRSGQYARAAKYTGLLKSTSVKFSRKRAEYKAYLFMFKTDSAQKKYLSAIENYRHYNFLKDSLYDLEKTKQVEELKIKYESDQKEQNITALEKNNSLQQENVKRADSIRNISISGAVVLLIFIILLYKSYRLNMAKNSAINLKNEALNRLVTDKEWLLKEIHHRVKNNLQIVTGLLQRQSAYIDNDEALAAIQNSENRMHAIALIHQKLYQSESLDLISMPEYIEEMIQHLKDSCALENRIVFEKHLAAISLDVAQAVPLGLILNEAITNAIKYAYKADENGIIYITLVNNEGKLNQLTIADDGPGLPEGFDLNKVDSLGINLIRGLSKQLGGSVAFSSEQGCTINIIFETEIFNKQVNHE
jgi:two-component sensor histidine kinase